MTGRADAQHVAQDPSSRDVGRVARTSGPRDSAGERLEAWGQSLLAAGRSLPTGIDVVAFATLAAVAALVHWHLTRGLIIYYDEYAWAFEFRNLGSGVMTLWGGWFDPLARLAYNLGFATAGLHDYRPFRALAVVANLTLAVALFAYGRSIGRRWLGLGASALALFLGSGAAVVLLPLNSMNALGVAALPAGLVLMKQDRRSADLLALAALLVAMGFAGPVSLPACFGVGAWVCLRRPFRAERLAVPLVPLVCYVAAFALLPGAAYPQQSVLHNLQIAPLYISELASMGAAGLPAVKPSNGPSILAGLAVAAAIGVPRLPAAARHRVLAVLVALVATWVLIGLARASLGDMAAPRYVPLTVVPILLASVDLVGNGLTARRAVVVAGVLAFCLVGNVGALRFAGEHLRGEAEVERAQLGALELALDRAEPSYRPDVRPEWPLLYVTAGDWRRTTRLLGSPAYPPGGLPSASPEGRKQADRILRELRGVEVRPLDGSVVPAEGGCVSGGGDAFEATVAATGTAVAAAGDRPVEVRLRRFADDVPDEASAVVDPGRAVLMTPAGDRSPVPWTVELRGGPAVACPGAGLP